MVDTVGLLRETFRKAGARTVADLGCGDGTIAAALAKDGFEVTGFDPSAEMLALARRRAPSATFVQAKVEELEAGAGFDAAFFVNSLHHVAPDRMRDALRSAKGIVRSGGPIVVIEPLAEGTFFAAMQPVDDESAIRAAAMRAVEAAVAEGLLLSDQVLHWEQESRFDGLHDFVATLVRVAPERAPLARERAAALRSAWEANSVTRDGKAVLVQPLIGWVLAAPAATSPAH